MADRIVRFRADTPDEVWRRAATRLGLDVGHMSTTERGLVALSVVPDRVPKAFVGTVRVPADHLYELPVRTVRGWLRSQGHDLASARPTTVEPGIFRWVARELGGASWGPALAHELGREARFNESGVIFVSFRQTGTEPRVLDDRARADRLMRALERAGVVRDVVISDFGVQCVFDRTAPQRARWTRFLSGGWLEIYILVAVREEIGQETAGDLLRSVLVRDAQGSLASYGVLAIVGEHPLRVELASPDRPGTRSTRGSVASDVVLDLRAEEAVVVVSDVAEPTETRPSPARPDMQTIPVWEFRSHLRRLAHT